MSLKTLDRNYSLDLLRILSMLMIQFLHICTHGNADSIFYPGTINWYIMKFIYMVCVCSVNIFIMISGYFSVYKRFNFKRLFRTCAAVWFYSWVCLIIVKAFGLCELTTNQLLTAIFPISYRQYWFATCYIVLSLLSPFLNKFLNHISRREYKGFLICLFVCMVLWHDFLPLSNPMGVDNGYSVVWFIFLYCLAGYIRIYKDSYKFSFKKCVVVFFSTSVVMTFLFVVLTNVGHIIPIIEEFNLAQYYNSYCSILTLFQALSLFLVFRDRELKNDILKKIIAFFAPLTFGVYLIHDNSIIRHILYTSIFGIDKLSDSTLSLIVVLFGIMASFVIYATFEFFRKLVFDKILQSPKIGQALDKIQNYIEYKIYRLS